MTQGELPDWDRFVDQNAKQVFGIAFRILGSVHDAEDVAQDVFTEAFRLHHSGPIQTGTGLLVRVATLRSIDCLRRKRPSQELQENDSLTNVQPFQELVAKELAARLRNAISGLPDQQAAVFTMLYFGQMNHEAIASSLGISPQAVSTALYKARQHMLAELTVLHKGETP